MPYPSLRLPRSARGVLLLLALALATAGCGSNLQLGKDDKEEGPRQGRPEHWRKPASSEDGEGPGGVFDAIIHGFGNSIEPNVNPPSYYKHMYGLWRRDHDKLTRMVGRNSTGTMEVMRQAVGSLSGMKEMLHSDEQRAELTELQERYERIAEKSTQGMKATAFSLALDRIKWTMEKKYVPGADGLVYRPADYFKMKEREEFEEEETFE